MPAALRIPLLPPRPALVLALLAALGACSGAVEPLPAGAQVACSTSDDCPHRMLCRVSTGRCVEPSTNEPPAVAIGAIPRTTGTVSIPLTAVDAEGDGCALTVTADLGGGFGPIAAAPTSVPASPGGTSTILTWDAAAALGGNGYREGLRVRIVPADARAAGAPVTSVPFAFGNDPPRVESLTVDDATVAGITVVRFTLSDSASDEVAVSRVEVSLTGAFDDAIEVQRSGGLGGNFPSGALVGLATSPAGVEHSLTWNSAALGAFTRPSARIRLWVQDAFGAESPSTASAPFALRNQTPPRVEPLFVKSDGALHNGLVPITYLLVDAEGDPADVLFEFSVDEGLTWSPCSEATVPGSEGLEALATSPAGVPHTWVWDSGANIALFAQSVRLQATASGLPSGPGPTTPLFQQRPVGLAPGIGREVLVADPVRQLNASSPSATALDLNGDGVPDLAYVTLSGQLGVRLGLVSGGRWTGAFASPGVTYPLFADGGSVAAGDLTCDGVPDLVVATGGNYFSGGGSPDVLQIFRGAGDGTFSAYGPPIPTGMTSEDVQVVDMDGDGHLDIVVVRRFGEARVLFSDGAAPACGFGESAILAGAGGVRLGIGDLDADGLQDVVFGDGTVYYGAPASSGSRFVAGADVPGLAGGPVRLVDVDGDGDADVVAAGFAARSNGQRGFDRTATFPVGAQPYDLAFADINGDGLLDVAMVNFGGGSLSVLIASDRGGVWEGGFVEAFAIGLAIGQQPSGVRTVDLDGDGRLDFVVADRSGGVETLLARPQSAFGAASLKGAQLFATEQFTSRHAFPADFDLDGVTDLLVGGFDATIVRGSRDGQAASGLFLPAELISFPDDVALPAVGDFDGDGFFDLVVAHPTISFSFSPATTASLFRGRPRSGAGSTFVAGTPPLFADGLELAQCTEALYVDADDLLDVVVVTSSGTTATARTFLGAAGGGFAAPVLTSLGGGIYGPSGCALADIDADGRLDLVLPDGSIWKMGGTGALTRLGGVSPAVEPGAAMALADYDLDGIVDAFVVRTGPDRVEVYRGAGANGVGNGTFTLAGTASGFSTTIADLQAVDLDGDGVVDIVATTAGRTVAVAIGGGRSGVGDATYRAPVEIASAAAALSRVTLFDANGDFIPDVAAVDPALSLPKALTVVTAMHASVTPAWRIRVGSGLSSRLLGPDTAPLEASLLGVRPGGSFTQWPFASGAVGAIDHNRGSVMTSGIFLQLLRGARLPGNPSPLTPLSAAWTWSGARSLARARGPDGALRLEVRERFGPRLAPGGPQRAGLSLSGTPQRGVVVELPVLPGRTAIDGKVRVFLRTLDYHRAADWGGDVLQGLPEGAAWLPREGGGDVIHPRFTWGQATQVPDLASGIGPRFAVDRSRTPAVIRVALDADATLQAFAVP